MSSSTDNLNLVKQANSENWSNDIHNANLQKIDDFAGLLMIDFGSKSVSAFCDALSSTMSEVANGQSVSFTVNFTDSVSPMSSGAHTGASTRSSSTRVNVILQRSGSATNENYVGSLTSNGWAWDKVATKSQIDNKVDKSLFDYISFGAVDLLQAVATIPADYFRAFRTTATTTNQPRTGMYGFGYIVRAGSNNILIQITEMAEPGIMYQNTSVNGGTSWSGWKKFTGASV